MSDLFHIPHHIQQTAIERMGDAPVEGFVISKASANVRIMIVGEAPGENEAVEGVPFIGRAGKVLEQMMEIAEITRDDVFMTSAVRSRPYRWGTKKLRDGSTIERKYNRPPTKKEILAHAGVLDYEIEHIQPELIIPVGSVGFTRLLGPDWKLKEYQGKVISHEIRKLAGNDYGWTNRNYTLIPTLHPASIFYRPSLKDSMIADWTAIGEFLKNNLV
ncbi:uracil-DNA glycosylase [Paenisporosarcina cavernae]|uniref:Uracil-DNA glycosylase n=1 Tax=Paenisporosarcina cavernae TaxID=2320858 RepID=A0A385YUR4_9BACL|nr:uracil-DNA glycosylase [Paenisporosarcina cavernae]AYC30426.1 uracil-DNA glycosylase [Paenisporosarcina cavernae]